MPLCLQQPLHLRLHQPQPLPLRNTLGISLRLLQHKHHALIHSATLSILQWPRHPHPQSHAQRHGIRFILPHPHSMRLQLPHSIHHHHQLWQQQLHALAFRYKESLRLPLL